MIEIDLMPFEQADFSRLIEWVESPEFLLQWAGSIFTFPLKEPQLERYLQESEGDSPGKVIFKAISRATSEVVGHVELDRIDLRNLSARLCRVLVGESSLRGKGLGSQMVRKALGVGFDQLKLHRIDLVVFEFNKAAISCYKNVGFIIEGRLREARRIGNQYWTLYIMSILENEWKSLAK